MEGDIAEVAETTTSTAAEFTPLAPLVVAKDAVKGYYTDPTIKRDAFAAGNWVERKTGSKVAGAAVAGASAALISVKRAIFGKGEWGGFGPPHPDFHYIKEEAGTVIVGPGAESMVDARRFPGKQVRYQ
jgi:hypothetical protein